MHVLLASHRFAHQSAGGTEVLTHDLAKALLARGLTMSWLAAGPPPPPAQALPGCTYLPVPEGFPPTYPLDWTRLEHAQADQIARLLHNRPRVDVVHLLHFARLGLAFLDTPPLRDVPVVATLTDYTAICPDHQLVKRHSMTLCQANAPSTQCLDCLQHPTASPAVVDRWRDRNIAWLNHRVRAWWAQTPHQAAEIAAAGVSTRHMVANRARYGLPDHWTGLTARPEGEYALFAGRCSPEKGLHLLLDAYTRTSCELPLMVCATADDDAYEDQLRKQAAHDPRIRWRGPVSRDELGPILAGARALLVPSQWLENHPIVAHEALALGIPVWASAVPSLRHLAGQPGLHLVEDYSVPASWEIALAAAADTRQPGPPPAFARLRQEFEDFADNTAAVYARQARP